MTARLISYSQPVNMVIDNIQDLVAYCARVSNPSNQLNNSTSETSIRYCNKTRALSPFRDGICLCGNRNHKRYCASNKVGIEVSLFNSLVKDMPNQRTWESPMSVERLGNFKIIKTDKIVLN